MEIDEYGKQNFIQFDASPNQGTNETSKNTPDYFLWYNLIHNNYKTFFNSTVLFQYDQISLSYLKKCKHESKQEEDKIIIWKNYI